MREETPRTRCAPLWASLILFSAPLWTTSPALAQDDGDEIPSGVDVNQESVRVRMELTDLPGKEPKPQLIMHRSEDNQGWRVTIQQEDKRKQELTTLTLVEWAGEAYYKYSVTVKPSSIPRHSYVLFEVLPDEDASAPPAASSLHIAWLVETPKRGTSRWKYITKAQHSDLDGGDLLWLEAKDSREWHLMRRRPEMGMRFCGLAEDEVFEEERFSPEKGIFIMKVDVDRLAEDASALQAFLPNAPFIEEDIFGYGLWRAATSDLRTPTDAATVLRPLELGDRALDTIWAEGAPGMGRGEFVSARIEASLPLKGFRIFPGHGEDQTQYDRWPRPSKLLVGISSGERFIVDLPDSPFANIQSKNGLLVEFASPVKTSCMSVLLLDGYPARAKPPSRKAFSKKRFYDEALAEHSAVAIAEITPISILQDLPPSSAANQILDIIYEEKDAGRRRKLGLMTRAYSKDLIAALRERLKQPGGLEKLDHAASLLAALPSEESVPLLIGMIDQIEPETGSWRSLRRALASHREAAARPLLEVLRALPPEQERKRIDIIRLYGRVASPEQLEALLGQLGQGGALERNERVRALASGNEAMIEPLIKHALEHLEEPGGIDALKALDTIGRRMLQRPELPQEQQDALLALGMQAKSRRSTVRVVHLLAHYQPGGSERLLSDKILLQRRDPIVRREAATALGTFDGEVSRRALEEALHDISPDVRIAAIRAMMARDDGKLSAPSVLNYVGRERWTDGLRPALTFLASLKDPDTDAKLEAMILDTKRPTRGYLTAQAYERARRGVDTKIPRDLLFQEETSYEMRRQLIELLAYDASEDGEAILLEVATKRPFARQEEPRKAEALTRASLIALGRRRSIRGQAVLLEIARAGTDHKLQLAAFRGLSFYADPELLETLGQMRTKAPAGLLEVIDETRQTISSRIDLERATKAIKDFEEKERVRQEEAKEKKEKKNKE